MRFLGLKPKDYVLKTPQDTLVNETKFCENKSTVDHDLLNKAVFLLF